MSVAEANPRPIINTPQNPSLLFLVPCTATGGVSRVLNGLSRELTARQWPVRTVFPQSEAHNSSLASYRAQGVAMETSPALLDVSAAHSREDMIALRRLVRQSDARVVNLHYGDTAVTFKDMIAIRLAGRRRCVITVHHPTPWSEMGDRREARMRNMRLSASLADAVVTVSEATRRVVMEAGVPGEKIRVVCPGTPLPERLPTRAEARSHLGLPADAFVIATLARLIPHKGISDLIKAAAVLPDPHGALRLLVGGDGPERRVLETQAAESLGARAIFLGAVPDTADLYAAADVFCLPSYLEGFGLVYIEAAFHGVPSIGTTVGGVPEAVLDGQTGLLVPPADPAALAAALQRIRDHPEMAHEMGRAAQSRARAEFTEAAMADRYAAALMS